MKEDSPLKISQSLQFEDSAAQKSLTNWQLSPLETYEARLTLLKVAILADYDELVCLPDLTKIDQHWYQLETAKKVVKQLGGRAILADEVGLG
ncbi:MAG: ATP-dependent helicase, partial [Microcystis panniformis]